MPPARFLRHPALVITGAVAVLAIVAAVILRFMVRSMFDSLGSGAVQYSTTPIASDPYGAINLVSAFGLTAVVVAIVAVTVGVVLAIRVARER